MEKESQGVINWCTDKMVALVVICVFGLGSLTLVVAVIDFLWKLVQASIFGAFIPAL